VPFIEEKAGEPTSGKISQIGQIDTF